MKLITKIILPIFMLILAGCTQENNISDSELFGDFEPLEWSDNFIVAATNFPASIQIWNKETGVLERNYSLSVEKNNVIRNLYIVDLEILDKNIWFIASGMQRDVIMLNPESGKMDFISLDCNPDTLEICEESKTVFLATVSRYNVGLAIRELDENANLINSYDVKDVDIAVTGIAGLRKTGDRYVMTASKSKDYDSENREGYKLLVLENGSYNIEQLKSSVLIKEDIETPDEYISSLQMKQSWSSNAPVFCELSAIRSPNCFRYLFRINSFEPFEAEYTGIKFDGESARSMFSVAEYDDSIFWTGRLLNGNTNGLECARYPKEGGEQIHSVILPHANQLYCARFEDCTWFSKNTYTQNSETLEWDKSGSPQIYKVDFKTKQVQIYDSDGGMKVVGEL